MCRSQRLQGLGSEFSPDQGGMVEVLIILDDDDWMSLEEVLVDLHDDLTVHVVLDAVLKTMYGLVAPAA